MTQGDATSVEGEGEGAIPQGSASEESLGVEGCGPESAGQEPPIAVDPDRDAPWIGPVIRRVDYERQYLWVHGAMLLSATVFFGWWALWMTAAMALATLGVYTLFGGILWLARRRWPEAASPLYALNMSLLLPLTLPVIGDPRHGLAAAVVLGLLVHTVGPAHRLRVHPVALVHLAIVLFLPFTSLAPVRAVLPPGGVVVGHVLNAGERIGGPVWAKMSVTPPSESVRRDDSSLVLLTHQRDILLNPSRLPAMLRGAEATPGGARRDTPELPRLVDVLVGGVPGPVGATCRLLLIAAGLFLMQRRIARPSVALTALLAALLTLILLPIANGTVHAPSVMRFDDIGWRSAVSYLAYQTLATPLPLIVLIMAPLTMPRSSRGRTVYAALIGTGVVLARWYIPSEATSYLPLVLAGLLTPALDRLRRSPFVRGG